MSRHTSSRVMDVVFTEGKRIGLTVRGAANMRDHEIDMNRLQYSRMVKPEMKLEGLPYLSATLRKPICNLCSSLGLRTLWHAICDRKAIGPE